MKPDGEWSHVAKSASEASERVQTILRELRHKYSIERAELVASVSEQAGDVRAELENARELAKECSDGVALVQRQLAAMTATHDGPADLLAATKEANAKLDAIRDLARHSSEETQLLKTALLNDRIRREERVRHLEAEEAEHELRLRQLEETNAALRAELQTVKSVNVETLASVIDLVEECKYDAPTSHSVTDMQRLRDEVLGDLTKLRAENALLKARVGAVVEFSENEERKRNANMASLESAVGEIRSRPALPADVSHVRISALPLAEVPSASARDYGLVHTPRRYEPPANSTRQRLHGFYATYNPGKLHSLDAILREYEGAEAELFDALEVHYGAFGYFTNH